MQKPLRSGQSPSISVDFLVLLVVFLWFPAGFLPPGPILESVFLWQCFCRQDPPSKSNLEQFYPERMCFPTVITSPHFDCIALDSSPSAREWDF